jgi:hypothetical protein
MAIVPLWEYRIGKECIHGHLTENAMFAGEPSVGRALIKSCRAPSGINETVVCSLVLVLCLPLLAQETKQVKKDTVAETILREDELFWEAYKRNPICQRK